MATPPVGPRRAPPPRVALIGFMGAGKTSVATIIARRLGYEAVDTDALVEARAGARIGRIFAERGEAAFRDLEAETLAGLAERGAVVIAAGGGAPAQERNKSFFQAAATFHLRVSLEAARERTRGDTGRPLMAQEDAALRRLYESREPCYERIGIPVETDGKSPEQVAERIIAMLADPRKNRLPADNVS